uniref:DNA-dependent metalloprotease SPRTN n=1 Tax=Sinocyclocheilus rhinocerous TaxID=307959 RepID=A0A673IAU3_9TELE
MEDEDFLLALRLQEQFDQETPSPERPLSIVDASWEMLDPNPDARAMFLQFNDKFFWGKLSGVEVKWSPRMTLCAGVCSYEGRGGLCSVRLSEPLLKLRPRKDLVQTLLHEMIHALLFVTQNNRDRDGHGPEFCNHMNRINQASGTNITIYHSFHDEVDVYRQHWWRCNGPCQNHRPFFGYVKRAMNRPPSARDPWWAEHQRTCGGTYTKIKEPENYGKTGKSDKKKDKNPSYESSKNSKPPNIRNVIPFNGRGFVLGGTSTNKQSQSPPKAQPEPLTSPPDSPLLPRLQPSEANSFKRVSSGASNVPRRKSVSNTNAFVNVDGSPVRISKVNDLKGKQRSVRDLFQAIVLKSPERAVSAPESNFPSPRSIGSPRTSGTTPSGAKKRSWDDHKSEHIFDYFQQTNGKSSTSTVQQREEVDSGILLVRDEQANNPPILITVHCPVCHIKVPESTINEHLDSCLSTEFRTHWLSAVGFRCA